MKPTVIVLGCAAMLVGLAVVEESRMSTLRSEIDSLKEELAQASQPTTKQAVPVRSPSPAPLKAVAKRMDGPEEDPSKQAKGAEFGETMRKIYENPAGQAMIREENRRRAAGIYERLISGLNLSDEEEEHFLDLLAPSVGEQDRVGMAMFNAENDEARVKLIDDMEKDQKDRREAIKTFLNNEEDFAAYEDHHARKSEYEQISSINTVMQDMNVPLSTEQESQLIEAMYEARTETRLSEKWEGRQGFLQYGEPGVSKRFAEDWGSMQDELSGRTEFLEEVQREALSEHQKQIEQFILMGIGMAETMIEGAQKQGRE